MHPCRVLKKTCPIFGLGKLMFSVWAHVFVCVSGVGGRRKFSQACLVCVCVPPRVCVYRLCTSALNRELLKMLGQRRLQCLPVTLPASQPASKQSTGFLLKQRLPTHRFIPNIMCVAFTFPPRTAAGFDRNCCNNAPPLGEWTLTVVNPVSWAHTFCLRG